MIPVRLPLDVRVVSVNKQLSEDLSLLVQDPYDKGWLLDARIDPAQLDACRLMTSWIADKTYSHDEQDFLQAVRDAGGMHSKPSGLTAYDGGEVSADVMTALGGGLYCALVGHVYCKT